MKKISLQERARLATPGRCRLCKRDTPRQEPYHGRERQDGRQPSKGGLRAPQAGTPRAVVESSETRGQESPQIQEHGFSRFRGKLREIASSVHIINLWSHTKAAVIRLGYYLVMVIGMLTIYMIITKVVSRAYQPQRHQQVDWSSMISRLMEYDRFVKDRRGGLREGLDRMIEEDRRSRT